MGKSDVFLFEEYEKMLCNVTASSIAFLGFSKENEFTRKLQAPIRDFYDLSLNNWNINEDWNLSKNYDLIVCTRCAFFSKNPTNFIEKCKNHLSKEGNALIDWGLGDHWRFDKYKIGWIRYGEQEYAYKPNNFLYSCYWNDVLIEDQSVKLFWESIIKNPEFGYNKNDDIKSVIEREIPALVDYKVEKLKTVFLWPERPQLYILTMVKK